MKEILILAGPNGAGKSTFASEFLAQEGCLKFVNADLIASSLAPLFVDGAAVRAGRIMLDEMRSYVQAGDSFGLETTLSGRGYLRLIREWKSLHYQVSLFFLRLNSPEEAINRVARRVSQGGHHIEDQVIIRRFHAGLKMFDAVYKSEVNVWRLYDNSGSMPILLEEGRNQ